MAFWSLLMIASMPNLQFLLVALLGAFLASGYINILSTTALRDVNKVFRRKESCSLNIFDIFFFFFLLIVVDMHLICRSCL